MKSKTIAVDLDDTLSHMVEYLLECYNNDYDDNLLIESITDWNLTSFVKKGCGREVEEYFKVPGFFLNPKPREDAQEVLEQLSYDNEIHVVTSYYPAACLDKVSWVKKHFPFIPEKNIIFCNNKHLISTDVLVDDARHNLVHFKGTPVMWARPWNEKYGNEFHRLYSWYDFSKLPLSWVDLHVL